MSEGTTETIVSPEPVSVPTDGGDTKSSEPEGGTPSPTPEVIKAPVMSFRAQFKAFSKFGDTKSDGKHITLSQSDKWMKQAKVIDGKKITTTDTGIYFKKLKQQKLNLEDYQKFLEDLAKNKKMEAEEIKCKLAACGTPGLTSNSVVTSSSTSKRLPAFKPDFPYC